MYLHPFRAVGRARPPCPGTLRPRRSAPPGTFAAYALLPLLLLALPAAPLRAQELDDGVLMPKRALGTGVVYAHDRWDRYWEGSLNRSNDNIGTLTTRSVAWMAGYGVTGRLSVLAMLPYVRTHASRGPLHEMRGLQDLTLAAKYGVLDAPLAGGGAVRARVVGAVGLPVGDYSPDFLPLSIGLGSRRVSGRLTLGFQARDGWFVGGSTAYTWRGKVRLDRAAYYTDGRLHLSDEVAMPEVFDYTVSAGYRGGRLHVPVSVTRQRTLGGGDIRRQDMPFVSDRMDFVRVGAAVGYAVPRTDLAVRIGAARVVSGRNVGEATTLTGGLHYLLQL